MLSLHLEYAFILLLYLHHFTPSPRRNISASIGTLRVEALLRYCLYHLHSMLSRASLINYPMSFLSLVAILRLFLTPIGPPTMTRLSLLVERMEKLPSGRSSP